MNLIKRILTLIRTFFQFGRNSQIRRSVAPIEIEKTGGRKIEPVVPVIIPVKPEFDIAEELAIFCRRNRMLFFDKINIFSLRSPLDDDQFNCVFLYLFRPNVGCNWESIITSCTTRPSKFYLDPENVRKYLGAGGYPALKKRGQHVNKFSIGLHRKKHEKNHWAFRQDLGPIPMYKMIGPSEYDPKIRQDYYCNIHHGKNMVFVSAQGAGCTVIQSVETEEEIIDIAKKYGPKAFSETILDAAEVPKIYRYCKDKIGETRK